MDIYTLKGTEAVSVMHYFEEVSKVPRESGNEEGIRQYLVDFAKSHNLWYVIDTAGNVIIRKNATSGAEGAPSIALQGHMDMVCVKDDGYTHDFAKDPLTLKVEGDILTAEGTTLGADNGIALAMILALFSDEQAIHGPLEGIFTVSEETGLNGAAGLEIKYIQSRRLINLDSEEEGVFYIGCAGGGEVVGTLPASYEEPSKDIVAWELVISGFAGGHSGTEIHTGRGNAIKSGIRFLKRLTRITDVNITSMAGGTKRNVIPNSFHCTFITPRGYENKIEALVKEIQEALRKELSTADPHAAISISKTSLPKRVITSEQSVQVINALYLTPHGAEAMSKTIPDLVETSNNLAIVKLEEDEFVFTASQRSSIASSCDEIEERTSTAFEICGASIKRENAYPAWTPNPDSPMTRLCADFYEKHTGRKPVITAIHAGLECGMINSKAKDMDSISFGPDISGVHTTDEQMSISSAARTYLYLLALVEDMTL